MCSTYHSFAVLACLRCYCCVTAVPIVLVVNDSDFKKVSRQAKLKRASKWIEQELLSWIPSEKASLDLFDFAASKSYFRRSNVPPRCLMAPLSVSGLLDTWFSTPIRISTYGSQDLLRHWMKKWCSKTCICCTCHYFSSFLASSSPVWGRWMNAHTRLV